MRRALLRDEDRVPEMTVVRNEFERGENSPFQVLYKHTFATAFREHPYHHPTIGWRSDIEEVTTERLKEFYDTFYHPNNATAMVIGDFEEAPRWRCIARHFGAIPPSPRPIPRVYTVEPPQEGERRFVVRRAGQVGLVRAVVAHGRGAARRHARARRARQHARRRDHVAPPPGARREEPRALRHGRAVAARAIPALFSIFAPVRPGVEPSEVESVDPRGDRARSRPTGSHRGRVRRRPARRSRRRSSSTATRPTRSRPRSPRRSPSPTGSGTRLPGRRSGASRPRTCGASFERYLHDDALTVGLFLPQEPSGGPMPRRRPDRSKRRRRRDPVGRRRPLAARPSRSRARRARSPTARESSSLENHFNPTLALSGSLDAGRLFAPPDRRLIASVTAGELTKGTARRTQARARGGPREPRRAASPSRRDASDPVGVDIAGAALSRDTELLLDVLAEVLRTPVFPEEELDKEKKRLVGAIRQQQDQTSARAYEEAMRRIYPDGPSLPPPHGRGADRAGRVAAPRGPPPLLRRALRRRRRCGSWSSATSTRSASSTASKRGFGAWRAGPAPDDPAGRRCLRAARGARPCGCRTRRAPTSCSRCRRT